MNNASVSGNLTTGLWFVVLHKFYLKKWRARSFFLTRMIKRGFLKTSGLSDHAMCMHFKSHNMCIERDVFVKTSDQFKVWKQDKECKILRRDIILASQNPEHKDISNSKFSKHHVTFCWCLHWKRNKNSMYVASYVLTLLKTTKKIGRLHVVCVICQW
jgi:ribosomal protein L36